MHASVLDDAAWASSWRRHQVGEKVVLSLGLVLTALLAPAWPGCLLVALAALGLMLLSARVRPRVLALVVAAPLAFVAVGVLPVAVQVGGTPVDAWWQRGPFSVGGASLRRAAELAAHSVAGALAMVLLATTTPISDLLAWARRCHLPAPLVEVAGLTYRLLWVLLASVLTIREAQHARLGDAAPLGRRLATSGATVGSVLVRSWEGARRLEDGLAGRGYTGPLPTLQQAPAASHPLRLGVVAVLAAIWACCWVVAR
ncbi:cobalt ECF transporter T component CbiQ [Luteococcus peritonei]|uniref:Cobalt ECF transporter T component CbiQ n=1 Tax=Luteococcus peritonei TaxID=88874 RepID=A0ABW4RVW9_9ACTN